MALDVKVGTFTKSSTTTGYPFTQDITTVGFQPKAIIFWGTFQSADGLAEAQESFLGLHPAQVRQKTVRERLPQPTT